MRAYIVGETYKKENKNVLSLLGRHEWTPLLGHCSLSQTDREPLIKPVFLVMDLNPDHFVGRRHTKCFSVTI
jgi:hypothetical protein